MHCACVLVGFRTRNEEPAETNVKLPLGSNFSQSPNVSGVASGTDL